MGGGTLLSSALIVLPCGGGPNYRIAIRGHHIEHGQFVLQNLRVALAVDEGNPSIDCPKRHYRLSRYTDCANASSCLVQLGRLRPTDAWSPGARVAEQGLRDDISQPSDSRWHSDESH
jgi:hypothetical protein